MGLFQLWSQCTTHSLGGVHIEEQTGDTDDLLLQQLLEEGEAIVERRRERGEVEPDVERRAGWNADGQAHGGQTREDVVALLAEVRLQRNLVLHDALRVEERERHDLHRVRGAAVQEGAGLGDGRDQVLRSEDPAHTPAGEAETLRQSVDDDDCILVYIVHVLGARDRLAQHVRVVVVAVPAVELVEHDAEG